MTVLSISIPVSKSMYKGLLDTVFIRVSTFVKRIMTMTTLNKRIFNWGWFIVHRLSLLSLWQEAQWLARRHDTEEVARSSTSELAGNRKRNCEPLSLVLNFWNLKTYILETHFHQQSTLSSLRSHDLIVLLPMDLSGSFLLKSV